jgi:HAE1 family hydrophobic/amphiphilic exporter-1
VFNVNGFSFAGPGPNRAVMFVGLKPFDQRSGDEHSAQAVISRIRGPLMGIRGALVIPFLPPSIQGVGTFGGLQLEVEDRAGGPIENLAAATFAIVGAASRDPRLRGLLATFTVDDPQILVAIDRERAKALGVTIDAIAEALQVYLGSSYVNDFDLDQRAFRVYVQADRQFRVQPRDISSLYVRSAAGAMVPLEELVALTPVTSPQVVSHFNLFRSAEINGSPAPGTSTGEAMAAVEGIAARALPAGMTTEWAGLSLEQQRAGGQVALVFGLAVLIVYLVLAAQYESFALPFIILLAVPIAILGALALLVLRGMISDVFAQIGMVMLVGLASKNAILIVEFGEQLRRSGRSLRDAAIAAAQIRLRPILMTSFAFILGVLPLMLASGAGAGSRKSLGTTVVGGMILSTFLNLVFIPVLYVVVEGWREHRAGPSLPRAAKLSEQD